MTTITLHLPDDLAARLSALPAEDVNAFAVAAFSELAETGDDFISAEEAAYLAPGIQRGLQAEAEGRFRPAALVFADFEARHGISDRASVAARAREADEARARAKG